MSSTLASPHPPPHPVECAATPATNIELAAEFLIAVPSMCLYALVITVYFKSPNLRSSYYLLFFVHSCINIAYFCTRALLMRVSSLSPICQWVLDNFAVDSYTFTAAYFAYHYAQHAQSLSIIAINVNRVVALYFYNKPELMRKSTHVLLLLIFLLPIPLTWHLLLSPTHFIVSINMIGMDYKRVINYPGLSLLHLIVDTAATAIVLLTTFLILAQMKSLRSRRKNSERSLIFVSFCLAFGLFLNAVTQYIINSIDRTTDTYFLVLNYRWIVNDFMSLFPPWSLLLLSSAVREEVQRVVAGKGFSPKATPNKAHGGEGASSFHTRSMVVASQRRESALSIREPNGRKLSLQVQHTAQYSPLPNRA